LVARTLKFFVLSSTFKRFYIIILSNKIIFKSISSWVSRYALTTKPSFPVEIHCQLI